MTKMLHIKAIIFFLAIILMGCKHNHKPASEELKQAYGIQQEALKINKDIEALTVELPQSLDEKRKVWLENMIEIPGMDHDHANCNHDHKPSTISITDAEMLAVQAAWKDSIVSIYETAKRLQND